MQRLVSKGFQTGLDQSLTGARPLRSASQALRPDLLRFCRNTPPGVHRTLTSRGTGGPAVSESLLTNADDRLPGASLGRVEGGDGIVEGRDVADVGPQSSVPHPLDDLTQLGTIGLDDEVDC
jgi:hypothetical protein